MVPVPVLVVVYVRAELAESDWSCNIPHFTWGSPDGMQEGASKCTMKGHKGDQVKELQEDQLSMMIVRLVNKTTLSVKEDAHFTTQSIKSIGAIQSNRPRNGPWVQECRGGLMHELPIALP